METDVVLVLPVTLFECAGIQRGKKTPSSTQTQSCWEMVSKNCHCVVETSSSALLKATSQPAS